MTPIPPRAPGAEPVLSFDQERYWLEHLLRPHAAYTIHGTKRLRGHLDVAALRRSVAAVVARHEALRTRFPLGEHGPVQVVDEDGDEDVDEDGDEDGASGRVELVDVSSGAGGREREEAARRLAAERAAAPFDLAAGPLLRCLLVRLDAADHLLAITMHHIVADAWSIDLLVGEIVELYRVGGDVHRARLPDLPIQYRDYAAWQRTALAGERLERHLAYWRRQLAGAPPALDLPAARRRTARQGTVGGRVHRDLTGTELAAVQALCRTHRVTPFVLLLALLGTVLARWSGRCDVVVGVPTTVRDEGSTQHLIGLFLNTLPMRVDLSGSPTFAELLARVRRVTLDGAVEHREAPLNALLGALDLPRDPTRTPLVQVALSMVQLADRVRLDDLVVEPGDAPVQPSTFDLNLFVRTTPGGVRLDPTFHADRYDPRTVSALLDQLARLLRAVAGNPDRGVLDCPLDDGRPPPARIAPVACTGRDRCASLSRAPAMVASAAAVARASGATACVPDGLCRRDPGAVVEWLRCREISVVHLNAPLLRAMAALDPAPLRTLRYAFVHHDGGLTPHDVTALTRVAPHARMVAVHRISGTGERFTRYVVPDDRPDGRLLDEAPLRIPLGTEADGVRVELRNAGGCPAATYEVGEIPGTGEHARRLPDGTLELVDLTPGGDPLEAVAALRDRSDVDAALVTAPAGPAGTPGLAVYVASRTGPDPAALRQHLVRHVRSTLVPETVTVLPELPLTGDGEYDLAALPSPYPNAVAGRP